MSSTCLQAAAARHALRLRRTLPFPRATFYRWRAFWRTLPWSWSGEVGRFRCPSGSARFMSRLHIRQPYMLCLEGRLPSLPSFPCATNRQQAARHVPPPLPREAVRRGTTHPCQLYALPLSAILAAASACIVKRRPAFGRCCPAGAPPILLFCSLPHSLVFPI